MSRLKRPARLASTALARPAPSPSPLAKTREAGCRWVSSRDASGKNDRLCATISRSKPRGHCLTRRRRPPAALLASQSRFDLSRLGRVLDAAYALPIIDTRPEYARTHKAKGDDNPPRQGAHNSDEDRRPLPDPRDRRFRTWSQLRRRDAMFRFSMTCMPRNHVASERIVVEGSPNPAWHLADSARPVDHTDARSVAGCGTDDCAEYGSKSRVGQGYRSCPERPF